MAMKYPRPLVSEVLVCSVCQKVLYIQPYTDWKKMDIFRHIGNRWESAVHESTTI